MRVLVTLGVFVAAALPALAQGPVPQSLRSPRPSSWILDQADVLNTAQEVRLNQLLTQLERDTGAEMAIVTLTNTDGREPKAYSTALFNHWGIGKRGVNNGVLFLVVMGRRRMEVEVGDGLRRAVPDAWVATMLTSTAVPQFRAGKPADGIARGVDQLISRIRQPAPAAAAPLPAPPAATISQPATVTIGGTWEEILAWARAIGLLSLLPLGLAYYFWAKYRRVRLCPNCALRLDRVSEREDDAHLLPEEQLEEKLGSIDHVVWVCPGCDFSKKEAWSAWLSFYSRCPGCSRRTLSTQSRTVIPATYYDSGQGLRIQDCRNCSYHHESVYTIPRKHRSSRSSGSSSGSSSGFGGGRSSGGGGGASW